MNVGGHTITSPATVSRVLNNPNYKCSVEGFERKDLDSVKDRIETDIYDQLKRIEEDVIDLHSYSQFPIIDR